MKTLFSTCLATAAAVLLVHSAQGQTVITSLPYTIAASGTYVLNSNLSSSQTTGNLITVNASNVTIDFQSHYIAGPVGNTSQDTIGVRATEQSNLTIKNGTIAYCAKGIYLNGNGNLTTNTVNEQIDNMRVTYCSYIGIAVEYSIASRITNCQISQTGYTGAGYVYGIDGYLGGILVQGNVVSGLTGSNTYGIYMINSFARQNTVSGAIYGIYGGKYQDNLTSSCTYPYTNGTDAGGNN